MKRELDRELETLAPSSPLSWLSMSNCWCQRVTERVRHIFSLDRGFALSQAKYILNLLYLPERQSSQSQTWRWTARVRLSTEVKVILTRIKAQIWTWSDTLTAPYSQLKHCIYNASSQWSVENPTRWTHEGKRIGVWAGFADSNFSFMRKAAYLGIQGNLSSKMGGDILGIKGSKSKVPFCFLHTSFSKKHPLTKLTVSFLQWSCQREMRHLAF